MTISKYDYACLPSTYLVWGCSCYRVEEVKEFMAEGAYTVPEDGLYYVAAKDVDEEALLEYCKLQEAINTAKEPLKVRIRQGYKSRADRDWSGLAGELWGSTTLVMVNFGNKKQFKEIQHRDLVLA